MPKNKQKQGKPKKTPAIKAAEKRLKVLIAEHRSMRESGVAKHRPNKYAEAQTAASIAAKNLREMRRKAGVQ